MELGFSLGCGVVIKGMAGFIFRSRAAAIGLFLLQGLRDTDAPVVGGRPLDHIPLQPRARSRRSG